MHAFCDAGLEQSLKLHNVETHSTVCEVRMLFVFDGQVRELTRSGQRASEADKNTTYEEWMCRNHNVWQMICSATHSSGRQACAATPWAWVQMVTGISHVACEYVLLWWLSQRGYNHGLKKVWHAKRSVIDRSCYNCTVTNRTSNCCRRLSQWIHCCTQAGGN